MKDYFENLLKKFNDLTDEQFEKLLMDSGLDSCPYEAYEKEYFEDVELKIKPKYTHKYQYKFNKKGLTEYKEREIA